jgi:hypothetical protein
VVCDVVIVVLVGWLAVPVRGGAWLAACGWLNVIQRGVKGCYVKKLQPVAAHAGRLYSRQSIVRQLLHLLRLLLLHGAQLGGHHKLLLLQHLLLLRQQHLLLGLHLIGVRLSAPTSYKGVASATTLCPSALNMRLI